MENHKYNHVRTSGMRMSSESIESSCNDDIHHNSLQESHIRSNVDAQRMVQESLKVYFPSVSQSSLDDIRIDTRLEGDSLSYSFSQGRGPPSAELDQCVTNQQPDNMSRQDSVRSQGHSQLDVDNLPLQTFNPSDPSQLVPENLCISEPHDLSDNISDEALNSVMRGRAAHHLPPHSSLPPPDSPMPPPESPMPLHLSSSSQMLESAIAQQIINEQQQQPPESPMPLSSSHHTPHTIMNQSSLVSRSLESPMPSHQHGVRPPPQSPMLHPHVFPSRETDSHGMPNRISSESHLQSRGQVPHILSPRETDAYGSGSNNILSRSSESHLPMRDLSMMIAGRTDVCQVLPGQRQDYPLPPMRTHYDSSHSSHRLLTDSSHLMRDSLKFGANSAPRYLNAVYRNDSHNAMNTPAPLTHSPMPADPSPSTLSQYYSYSPHGSSQQYGSYLTSDACMERDGMMLDDTKLDRAYQDVKPFDQEYPLPMHITHEFSQDPPPPRMPKPKKPKEPKPPRIPVVHKCKECNRVFKNSTQLKNHMWRHTGEKPFTCDQCGSKFTQQGNLRAHKRIHTGERPYQCEVCKHCFTQLSTLKTHQKIHSDERPHKCNLCDAAFRQVANLKTHQVTHTGERPHKCDLCDKAFTQKSNLKAHKNRVHNPDGSFMPNSRRGRKKNPAAIKPFSCPECGAKFTMMSNLKIHMKLHAGSREYTCDLCGAAFSYRTNLKSHIQRMHNSIRKKVKCDECPATFRLKRCLKAHKRKRHPIKSLKIKILGESKYFMRERSGPGLAEDIDESLLEEAEEGEDRSYMAGTSASSTSVHSEPLVQIREPKEEPLDMPPSPTSNGVAASAENSATSFESTAVKQELDEPFSGSSGGRSTPADCSKASEDFSSDPESDETRKEPSFEEASVPASCPEVDSTAISLVENFVSELDSKMKKNDSAKYPKLFNSSSSCYEDSADSQPSSSSAASIVTPGHQFVTSSTIEQITQQLTVNLDRWAEEFKIKSSGYGEKEDGSKPVNGVEEVQMSSSSAI